MTSVTHTRFNYELNTTYTSDDKPYDSCTLNGKVFVLFSRNIIAEKGIDLDFEDMNLIFLGHLKTKGEIVIKADSVIAFETPVAKRTTFDVTKRVLQLNSEEVIKNLFFKAMAEKSGNAVLHALRQLTTPEMNVKEDFQYFDIPFIETEPMTVTITTIPEGVDDTTFPVSVTTIYQTTDTPATSAASSATPTAPVASSTEAKAEEKS